MGTSVQPVGDVQVLGRSRFWPAVAIPGTAAAVLIIVAVVFRMISWYAVFAVAASLVLAVVRRRNAVLADDVGLLLEARGETRRSYAWTEIDRMGWQDAGIWGSLLQVYPRGGPYDVPGPNSPINIGRIWTPGRGRRPDPLPGLRERHGIKTLLDH